MQRLVAVTLVEVVAAERMEAPGRPRRRRSQWPVAATLQAASPGTAAVEPRRADDRDGGAKSRGRRRVDGESSG
ncbi:hypothetical protein OsJ_35612 [Oryza sativa Japonica Group]|uniref:Uncharacterized protein n=1 Tax=Oryza sativa subsp. japonica TaxID=39947 RepID=B9GCF8_ORYSJ|nr:hypothetical protein OsJ_35612 [Oryza sativa Japonica Group]